MLVLPLALMAAPAVAGVTEVQPGVQYGAGQRIGVGELGVSLEVPAEWLAGLPVGSEALMMGSHTRPGLVLVTASRGVGVEALAAELAKAQPIEGILLRPDGAPAVSRDVVTQRYTATSPTQPFVGHARAIVGAHGTSVLLLAVGPAEHDAYYADLVATVGRGLVFAAPQQVAVAAGAPGGGSWETKLRGVQLAYLKSESGFTDERRLWLCSDGTFSWKDASSAFSSDVGGDFSAVTRDVNTGRWSVAGSTLKLAFDDGRTAEWTLSSDGGRTYVNGTRWLLVDNDRCR